MSFSLNIWRASIAALQGEYLEGIGISLGGHIASDGLSVRDAVNLRDYEGKPLVRQLEETFGCPVRLAHDTVCGLLAEKAFGALAPFDLCAYVTVSTGTGAAIQLRKHEQALTVSMEMGHQLLAGNTRTCLCGQVGCLETVTGGKQIALRFGREAAQVDDSAFWEEFTEALALGIVNLARLTRVEAIALSGGIALNVPYFARTSAGACGNSLRARCAPAFLVAVGRESSAAGRGHYCWRRQSRP